MDAKELDQLKAVIRCFAPKQLTDEQLGAQCKYDPATWQKLLKSTPDLRNEVDKYRLQGLGDLQAKLWEKATVEKNWDALKFMAFEYLPLKNVNRTDSPFTFALSDDQMKQMKKILDKPAKTRAEA